MLGHDGPPTNYWTENLITGEPLQRCPLRTLQLAPPALALEIQRHVDSYYPAYEQGLLLNDGGLAAQPARYVALVQLAAVYQRLVQLRYEALTANSGDED